jgi:hypothetical protein
MFTCGLRLEDTSVSTDDVSVGDENGSCVGTLVFLLVPRFIERAKNSHSKI